MMDFLFFLKTLALCLVITIIMQIKVDEKTIESHTHNFLQTAAVMLPIQAAAHGGAQMVKDITHKISSSIKRNMKSSKNKEAVEKPASSFLWQGSPRPSQNETESEE